MDGNGSSGSGGDSAQVLISGSGHDFSMVGVGFEEHNPADGNVNYLMETATGSTSDYVSIEGGNNVHAGSAIGVYSPSNGGAPTHYKQDAAGIPKLDTTVIPTVAGLSYVTTSKTGGIYSGSVLSGVTTGSGVLTLSGLPAAPNSWNCQGGDQTAANSFALSSSTSTSCALTGSTTSGDTVWYSGQAH